MLASNRTVCYAVLVAFTIATASYADNWPGWRGPRGDGSSPEVNVPTQWSATENVAWKVAIPGEGHACPVVWGDRVFIATAMAEERLRVLMCLDRKSGATLWQRTVVTSSPETKHHLNTYASSTPVTDGKLVYATFFQSSDQTIVATNVSAPREVSVGKMVVAAYDFEGNQKWIAEPGEFISVHGYCSCPVLFENLLIVNGDHDGDSFLVALNQSTGEIEWKVPRVNKTRSYCTPIIREFAGRTQMIMSGNKSVTSYNPRSGELLWSMDGPTEQFVASMVDNGKYVFLTAGYPDKHILAIDPTGTGTIDESKIVWRSKRNCAYVPSPIVVGNYFLVTSDDGILSCYNSMSGERIWFVRLGSHYSGSPITAGGLVYFTADDGITKVVRPGAEFELVSECKLGEECYSSPAMADGQLFIRTKQNLFCIVTAAPKSGVLINDLAFSAVAPRSPTPIPLEKMPNVPLELMDSSSLFVSGTHDTHTFRIPAIITAQNGDLLAACDARRVSAADLKPQRTIDIVYRRSSDNGKTWTPIEVLDQLDEGGCSDPSLLLDSKTSDIFCFYNYMVRDLSNKEFRFMVQKSSDHGKTWSRPIDFTDQVAGPVLKNSFKFITSGRGIQTRDGMLLHNFVRVGQGVTLFASKDHGVTWQPLCEVSPGDESKVVQLHDDSLMVNSRVEPGKRFVHRSADFGRTWTSAADWNLPDPQCNASIIQYTSMRDGFSKNRLIFCNAASLQGRKNLTARISYDGGNTWSAGRVIDSGASAYSEIAVLQDGSFGVLYERGNLEIRFVRFTLENLTGGLDRLQESYKLPAIP